MNILIYLDRGAQQFDANGFHHVAAALRTCLAQEIQRADRATFFEWVLGLPHALEDVEAIYFDGVQIKPNEYLEALKVCGCNDRACAYRAGMAARADKLERWGGPVPPQEVPLFRFEDRWALDEGMTLSRHMKAKHYGA